MQAATRAVTDEKAELEVLTCAIVKVLADGEPVKMSKRAGSFITLRDVLDQVGRMSCALPCSPANPAKRLILMWSRRWSKAVIILFLCAIRPCAHSILAGSGGKGLARIYKF